VYYVVGLVLKSYFRVSKCVVTLSLQGLDILSKVRRISLSKNILRALEANRDVPALHEYPRAHQVRGQLFSPRHSLT
jgi:COP9 signalosome complex subunit 12